MRGDAGGEAVYPAALALRFAEADARFDRVPRRDLADRLRRGLPAVAGQEDVGGLRVRQGIADRVVASCLL